MFPCWHTSHPGKCGARRRLPEWHSLPCQSHPSAQVQKNQRPRPCSYFENTPHVLRRTLAASCGSPGTGSQPARSPAPLQGASRAANVAGVGVVSPAINAGNASPGAPGPLSRTRQAHPGAPALQGSLRGGGGWALGGGAGAPAARLPTCMESALTTSPPSRTPSCSASRDLPVPVAPRTTTRGSGRPAAMPGPPLLLCHAGLAFSPLLGRAAAAAAAAPGSGAEGRASGRSRASAEGLRRPGGPPAVRNLCPLGCPHLKREH